MAQSIASLRRTPGTDGRSGGIVESILSGAWSSLSAIRLKVSATIRRIRKPFAADIANAVDIEKISAQFNVEKRAQSDGRDELPPETDEAVQGTQREIVVYFRELQRRAHYQVVALAKKLRELGGEIDLLGTGSRLRDIPSRYENDVRRLVVESQSQLNFLAEKEIQHRQDYDQLRESSTQTAAEKPPTSVVFHLALLAGLAGLGGSVIARLLPLTSAVEAALIPTPAALAISSVFIVVLVSYVLARAVSKLVKHIGQWFAWPGGAASVVLIASMASLAAYCMEVVKSDPGVMPRSVIDAIFLDAANVITHVADWRSFIVFVAAGLVAFLIGYRQVRKNPDATLQRDIHGTRAQRERLSKRLRMQINAIADKADAEVTALGARLKASSGKYSGLMDEAKRFPALLSDYDVALEDGCNILLDRYRAVNRSVRQTGAPISFSEHVCFRPEHEADFSVLGNGEQRLEELRRDITEFESEATQVRQKLRDINSRAIGALEDTPG